MKKQADQVTRTKLRSPVTEDWLMIGHLTAGELLFTLFGLFIQL